MSVTDGQHKVPIAIQRPAPSPLLARGDLAAEQGSRRPGPLQARPQDPKAPRPAVGVGAPDKRSRGGAGQGARGPAAPGPGC